jgi:hypothetical protein
LDAVDHRDGLISTVFKEWRWTIADSMIAFSDWGGLAPSECKDMGPRKVTDSMRESCGHNSNRVPINQKVEAVRRQMDRRFAPKRACMSAFSISGMS